MKLPARAIRLQRLQRRSRRLGKRSVVFLNRGQRLTHPLPKSDRNLTQRFQYVFLPRRLHLLLVEDLTGPATLGLQLHHVLASERSDRTLQHRRAPGPLADSASDVRSEPRIRRMAHKAECALYPLVRDEAEEGRL